MEGKESERFYSTMLSEHTMSFHFHGMSALLKQ
jgi:hypothetical protein